MTHSVFHEDFESLIMEPNVPNVDLLSGRTLLVTGACGLIGSYVCEFIAFLNDEMLRPHCKIIGIDNLVSGDKGRLTSLHGRSDFALYVHDVAMGVPDDIVADCVIHAASVASPKIYQRIPLETMKVNAYGTWNVLERTLGWQSRAVLYLSSSEVYGDPDVVPTPESYSGNVITLARRSCYDESKRFAETLCWEYNRWGVPVKIARPFNIYGGGHKLTDGRIVPQLMNALVNKTPFTIYGDGSATRSFCYLSDAVAQLFTILFDGVPGEAYNVGDGNSEISMAGFADIARQVFPELEVAVDQENDAVVGAPTRRRPDVSKVSALGAKIASVGLREGLARTYRWHCS